MWPLTRSGLAVPGWLRLALPQAVSNSPFKIHFFIEPASLTKSGPECQHGRGTTLRKAI